MPVQTGAVGDRSVSSVSIVRPTSGVGERNAMALKQLAIDDLRLARILVTVDERNGIVSGRVLHEAMPESLAEPSTNEKRPEIITSERRV